MVKCSICKQEGHNKAKCSIAPTPGADAAQGPAQAAVRIELPAEILEKLTKLSALCAEVASGLGKGHVEAHYQQALCVELQEANIRHVAEEVMPIMYKGRALGGTCNARLDIMLHSFLPFIFELKAVPSRIGSIHHWQLVRYMTHKGIPYGAVVNFNQSERGPLEVQFIVQDRGAHWLYDPLNQTGRPLVDFALAPPPAPASGAASVATQVESEDDWEWNEEE
jgi:GxxExxY protein